MFGVWSNPSCFKTTSTAAGAGHRDGVKGHEVAAAINKMRRGGHRSALCPFFPARDDVAGSQK